jgi:hypothetical protein
MTWSSERRTCALRIIDKIHCNLSMKKLLNFYYFYFLKYFLFENILK